MTYRLDVNTEGGSRLIAAFSTSYSDRGELFSQVGQFVDFDANMVNDLLMYIEDRFEKIGFLGSLYVDGKERGQGQGTKLMKSFEDKIMQRSEMDFLFARFDTPQAKGFDLIDFYRRRGFEPVKYSNGDMLMVSKGHALEIRLEVFGLRRDPYPQCEDEVQLGH